MAKEISIRRLKGADLPRVREIMKCGDVFSKTDKHDLYKSISVYLKEPDDDEFITYAATLDSELVGFVSYGRELGKDTYGIYIISVDADYQGRGIGSSLMEFAEKRIKAKRARAIFISTSSTRQYTPARALYKSRGYSRVAKVKDYFTDGDDMLIYSKRLRKPAAN
jgi:ribosomal protein S18 acetylase RimI-like enzyme